MLYVPNTALISFSSSEPDHEIGEAKELTG
jgi:hypothetical protein